MPTADEDDEEARHGVIARGHAQRDDDERVGGQLLPGAVDGTRDREEEHERRDERVALQMLEQGAHARVHGSRVAEQRQQATGDEDGHTHGSTVGEALDGSVEHVPQALGIGAGVLDDVAVRVKCRIEDDLLRTVLSGHRDRRGNEPRHDGDSDKHHEQQHDGTRHLEMLFLLYFFCHNCLLYLIGTFFLRTRRS